MIINPTNSDKKIIIDDSDYDLIKGLKWLLYYKKKNKRKYYVKSTTKINGRQVSLHRYLLGITDSNIYIDHKNGNPLDNRRINLRVCSIADNNRNKTSHTNSTSKYLGVSYDKARDKWATCVCFNRKKVFRKRFDIELDAAIAYNREAKKYFGKFANLNTV